MWNIQLIIIYQLRKKLIRTDCLVFLLIVFDFADYIDFVTLLE